MQISSRFTIAIHIFACIEVFGEEQKITSDFLSASIQVNPVVIRNVMLKLRNAGLIETDRGHAGTTRATRKMSEITFYDIYKATDLLEDGQLFHFHENPNPECPVGRNIHAALDDKLSAVQKTMEEEMKSHTIEDVVRDIRVRLAGKD